MEDRRRGRPLLLPSVLLQQQPAAATLPAAAACASTKNCQQSRLLVDAPPTLQQPLHSLSSDYQQPGILTTPADDDHESTGQRVALDFSPPPQQPPACLSKLKHRHQRRDIEPEPDLAVPFLGRQQPVKVSGGAYSGRVVLQAAGEGPGSCGGGASQLLSSSLKAVVLSMSDSDACDTSVALSSSLSRWTASGGSDDFDAGRGYSSDDCGGASSTVTTATTTTTTSPSSGALEGLASSLTSSPPWSSSCWRVWTDSNPSTASPTARIMQSKEGGPYPPGSPSSSLWTSAKVPSSSSSLSSSSSSTSSTSKQEWTTNDGHLTTLKALPKQSSGGEHAEDFRIIMNDDDDDERECQLSSLSSSILLVSKTTTASPPASPIACSIIHSSPYDKDGSDERQRRLSDICGVASVLSDTEHRRTCCDDDDDDDDQDDYFTDGEKQHLRPHRHNFVVPARRYVQTRCRCQRHRDHYASSTRIGDGFPICEHHQSIVENNCRGYRHGETHNDADKGHLRTTAPTTTTMTTTRNQEMTTRGVMWGVLRHQTSRFGDGKLNGWHHRGVDFGRLDNKNNNDAMRRRRPCEQYRPPLLHACSGRYNTIGDNKNNDDEDANSNHIVSPTIDHQNRALNEISSPSPPLSVLLKRREQPRASSRHLQRRRRQMMHLSTADKTGNAVKCIAAPIEPPSSSSPQPVICDAVLSPSSIDPHSHDDDDSSRLDSPCSISPSCPHRPKTATSSNSALLSLSHSTTTPNCRPRQKRPPFPTGAIRTGRSIMDGLGGGSGVSPRPLTRRGSPSPLLRCSSSSSSSSQTKSKTKMTSDATVNRTTAPLFVVGRQSRRRGNSASSRRSAGRAAAGSAIADAGGVRQPSCTSSFNRQHQHQEDIAARRPPPRHHHHQHHQQPSSSSALMKILDFVLRGRQTRPLTTTTTSHHHRETVVVDQSTQAAENRNSIDYTTMTTTSTIPPQHGCSIYPSASGNVLPHSHLPTTTTTTTRSMNTTTRSMNRAAAFSLAPGLAPFAPLICLPRRPHLSSSSSSSSSFQRAEKVLCNSSGMQSTGAPNSLVDSVSTGIARDTAGNNHQLASSSSSMYELGRESVILVVDTQVANGDNRTQDLNEQDASSNASMTAVPSTFTVPTVVLHTAHHKHSTTDGGGSKVIVSTSSSSLSSDEKYRKRAQSSTIFRQRTNSTAAAISAGNWNGENCSTGNFLEDDGEPAGVREANFVARLDEVIWRVSRVVYRHLLENSRATTTSDVFDENYFNTESTLSSNLASRIASLVELFSSKQEEPRPRPHPKFSEVFYFVRRIAFKAALSCECITISLIYAEKLREVGILLRVANWRPIVIASLLVASKVWEDSSSWNVEFAEICPDFPLSGINKLERTFCRTLNYALHIKGVVYVAYHARLKSLGDPPWKARKQRQQQILLRAANCCPQNRPSVIGNDLLICKDNSDNDDVYLGNNDRENGNRAVFCDDDGTHRGATPTIEGEGEPQLASKKSISAEDVDGHVDVNEDEGMMASNNNKSGGLKGDGAGDDSKSDDIKKEEEEEGVCNGDGGMGPPLMMCASSLSAEERLKGNDALGSFSAYLAARRATRGSSEGCLKLSAMMAAGGVVEGENRRRVISNHGLVEA